MTVEIQTSNSVGFHGHVDPHEYNRSPLELIGENRAQIRGIPKPALPELADAITDHKWSIGKALLSKDLGVTTHPDILTRGEGAIFKLLLTSGHTTTALMYLQLVAGNLGQIKLQNKIPKLGSPAS